jgi:hypothetical protein
MGSDSDRHISRFLRLHADPTLVDRFERRAIMENTRIVSRCKQCGTTVVGSANSQLAAKEGVHAQICAEIAGRVTRRIA